jgi:hypothetical protein
MNDDDFKAIAKIIMRENDVDNLEGFGNITIGRIERMLIAAAKAGATKALVDE